jgi:adenosylcobinamide-GDP ribazoletransferase
VTGLRAAVIFLTRIPIPGPARPISPAALPWFPVVGALLGLVAAVVYAGASLAMSSALAAALAVATTILLTGALHEDGLADAADAWGGASTRDEALRILRDPRHGTYGVLAIVLSVVLRIAALASLTPPAAVSLLPAVHALSRGAMVPLLGTTPRARPEGLTSELASQTSVRVVGVTLVATLAIGGALLAWWIIPAAVVVLSGLSLVRWLAIRRIGGITGDVLGAAQQLTEIALLALLAAGSTWSR